MIMVRCPLRLHRIGLIVMAATAIGGGRASAASLPDTAPSSAVTYDYSFITNICSPTDFSGVAVYLLNSRSTTVPPVGEHVRVEMWGALGTFAHKMFRWPGGGPTFDYAKPALGDVRLCAASGLCRSASEGYVVLDGVAPYRVTPTHPVEGELDFQFDNGQKVRQRFKAAVGPWGLCP
jgi:hypothetical protein